MANCTQMCIPILLSVINHGPFTSDVKFFAPRYVLVDHEDGCVFVLDHKRLYLFDFDGNIVDQGLEDEADKCRGLSLCPFDTKGDRLVGTVMSTHVGVHIVLVSVTKKIEIRRK